MVAYSFKRRFVTPIRLGLQRVTEIGPDEDPLMKPKLQTIRAIGLRRHARPGETLQLYHGMRSKQCFKIGEARCVSVVSIRIAVHEHSMPTEVDGKLVGGGSIHEFARADGFEHAEDMLTFWKSEHGLGRFVGLLIKWEPLT